MKKKALAGLAIAGFAAIFGTMKLTASDPVDPFAPAKDRPIEAISKPSKDVIVSFVQPGRVTQLLIKDGDIVKKDQLLAMQDDSVELCKIASDQAKADDDTQINAETMIRDQKQVEWDKFRELPKGGASPTELRDAEVDVKVAEARIQLAMEQKRIAGLDLGGDKAAHERLKVLSPIDGDAIVALTMIKEGEVADGQNMKVARLVQVDPMWVEANVPVAQARKLKNGDAASIHFTDTSRQGKIIWVSPVGDPASNTIEVRIEVPNKTDPIQPGENVQVSFTSPATPAK